MRRVLLLPLGASDADRWKSATIAAGFAAQVANCVEDVRTGLRRAAFDAVVARVRDSDVAQALADDLPLWKTQWVLLVLAAALPKTHLRVGHVLVLPSGTRIQQIVSALRRLPMDRLDAQAWEDLERTLPGDAPPSAVPIHIPSVPMAKWSRVLHADAAAVTAPAPEEDPTRRLPGGSTLAGAGGPREPRPR
jgi:hypothetical protein